MRAVYRRCSFQPLHPHANGPRPSGRHVKKYARGDQNLRCFDNSSRAKKFERTASPTALRHSGSRVHFAPRSSGRAAASGLRERLFNVRFYGAMTTNRIVVQNNGDYAPGTLSVAKRLDLPFFRIAWLGNCCQSNVNSGPRAHIFSRAFSLASARLHEGAVAGRSIVGKPPAHRL